MEIKDTANINWSEKILAECIGEEPPPCQTACPLDIRVREKLRFLKEGNLAAALAVVLERCPFPGILGRICFHPCEGACTRNQLEAPIAIAGLKRYLADLDPQAVLRVTPGPERPPRVAVVGGGPAGLMAAYELRILGYQVTLFEAEGALGGALRLYVPVYRLPREVLDREVSLMEQMGVEVRYRVRLGRDIHLEDLRRDFAAVFLALGTHKSLRLEVPGEDLPQVLPGLDFLKGANRGQVPQVGPRAAVIGGGNVAVDVARTARRHGAAQVTLICLETLKEMPASPWEVEEVKLEGIDILAGWGVKRILGQEDKVTGLELKAVAQLCDDQGRFAPTYHEDRLTTMAADAVLVAIGQTADFNFFGPGLAFDTATSHRLEADPQSLQTRIPGVFAGGDLVTGPGTAVAAFAAGRRAALAIHCYLEEKPLPEILPPLSSRSTKLIVDLTDVPLALRQIQDHLPLAERLSQPRAEVELGFNQAGAATEAARCLACVCSQCVTNCTFLQRYVTHYPFTEKELVRILQERGAAEPLIPYSCHFCGLCQAVCPQDLHAGQACLQVKQRLVEMGKGPLPQHQGIQNYVKWGTSPHFTLSRPDPATGKARRVFFPGCSLPGYSPHLVRAAYAYLRGKLPGTGLMLNCCGAPSQLLGENEVLERVINQVATEMEKLGAQELIAACTHCLHTIAQYRPQIKTRSLYEVILEMGLPEGMESGPPKVFNIHDACGARQAPAIQEAVRRLVTEMGHTYEEMPHSRERSLCCGAGGMVPAVDAPLAQKMTDCRLSEAHRDLITYCATCRARFAAAHHPALHVLELLFNPRWEQARTARPSGSLKRWWRRWRLKGELGR
ncbi:MAG: FAD-dependent oxidoreductase [Desulfobaccales bacterium]|nr:FAD-dependent oxidoreductase [Desulfobaccales bacterium]